jgi:outer membrane protein assembly factor BamB
LLKRGRIAKGSPKVYASPVAADGKIYIGTLEGQMAVLQAGAQWEVLATNDLEDEIWATPAIADGTLYVRTRGRLSSFAAPQEVDSAASP